VGRRRFSIVAVCFSGFAIAYLVVAYASDPPSPATTTTVAGSPPTQRAAGSRRTLGREIRVRISSAVGNDAQSVQHFLYWVDPSSSPLLPRRFQLVGSGLGTPRVLPHKQDWSITVVLDSAGTRTIVQNPREALASAIPKRRRVASVRWEFTIIDPESEGPGTALLVDTAGQPWGPVESGSVVALPAGFRGFLVAPGYVAAPVQFMDSTGFAVAQLRPAAWIRGRLTGAAFDSGELWVYDVGSQPFGSYPPTTVAVRADGLFEAGPMLTGEKRLRFASPSAWLVPGACAVTLTPGHQDLGDLRLGALAGLHLQVVRIDGKSLPRAFVSLCAHGLELPNSLGAIDCASLPNDGGVRLGPYEDREILVQAWTSDGWFGAGPAEGVRSRETSLGSPARIDLLPPGTVWLTATTVPFGVPPNCSILVFPSQYHRDRHARLKPKTFQPEERCRRIEMPVGGVVEIPDLWSTRTGFALVTASGSILATKFVDVVSDSMQHVTLRPSVPLAALDVANDGESTTRFAILPYQRGMTVLGTVEPASTKRFLLPAGRFRWQKLTGDSDSRSRHMTPQNQELVLKPGDSTILRFQ
jgi:hypothetical protein